MEDTRPVKALADWLKGSRRDSILGAAAQVTDGPVADGRFYSCLIDNLTYPSLEIALVHARMQHGLASHGQSLLRAKLIGGGF